MEAILLETSFLGDLLINGVAGDMRRNRPMEGSIEVRDGLRIRKRVDTRFDHGERCSVVSANRTHVSRAMVYTGADLQRGKIRETFDVLVTLFVDDNRLEIIATMYDTVTYMGYLAAVDTGLALQVIEEVCKCGRMIVYGVHRLFLRFASRLVRCE